MKLNLKRPIAFFDLETTGINVTRDRIVEISILKVTPTPQSEESITQRINPEMPIPPDSSAIHGITDDMVKDEPTFAKAAPDLYRFLDDCDLGGYNCLRFDIPVLIESFNRVGFHFDITDKQIIDVQNIFHKMEKRTLVAAYRFYCNKDLEDAHSAAADTKATYEVLKAQLERYDEIENDVAFLHAFSGHPKQVDLMGRFVKDDRDRVCFNFGKHKGKTVAKVLDDEPSYYSWMMKGDFPQNTKDVLKRIKDEINSASGKNTLFDHL